MPPAKAQCRFCDRTFSKRSNLHRHWMLDSCSNNPNPRNSQPRCPHCDLQFANRPSFDLHLTRNRCRVLCQQQQQLQPQQHGPQPQQEGNAQQNPPQLPTQLMSMPKQQQIQWIMEVLNKNDEQVSQSLLQAIWAMVGTMPIYLPAVNGKSSDGREGVARTTTSQQQQSGAFERIA